MTFLIIRLLHLLFMAVWLAAIVKEVSSPLVFTGDQQVDKKQYQYHAKIAGILGILGGVGAIFTGGWLGHLMGFSNLPWSIHAGFTIAFVMGAITIFGIGWGYRRIGKAIEKGAERLELEALSKKLRYWGALLLVLWTTVFLSMVLRHIL